tara:strand:- start:6969 stop:8318 length:1350 start_codon:yes stop_codon:yes gene_type:complete
MSRKALFLTDNNVLGDVFAANLKAYVDLHVETVDSLENFQANVPGPWDLFMSISMIENQDAAKQAFDIVHSSNNKVPFVVVGQKSELSNSDSVVTIAGNLDIKSLVKAVAGIFKVGAKDMMAVEVPAHFPMPIKLFQYLDSAPCDVFVQTNKNPKLPEFAKVWEKGVIRRHVIKEYIERGIEFLYVPAADRLNVINIASTQVIQALDNPELSKEAKLDLLEQGFEVVAARLTDNPKVSAEVVTISKKCIEHVTEVIKEFPQLKSLLAGLAENKSRYLYFHSILATYICNHVVKYISWGGEGHSEKISFVLYFHDIFLVPIYNKYPQFKFEEELVFNNLLTDKEKEVVVGHARMAGELVKTFPRVPMGADAIVTQHHGVTSGTGFTLDYRDDVSPLAKVIIVAEAFVDEIITVKDDGGTPDRTAILASLRAKFPRHTYIKIIDTLENLPI